MNYLAATVSFEASSNPHFSIQSCSGSSSHASSAVREVTSVGFLCGAYFKGQTLSPSQLLNLLLREYSKNDTHTNNILRSIVGPCYIIIKEALDVFVYSSCSSNGFSFFRHQGVPCYSIFNSDRKSTQHNTINLYKYSSIIASVYSHHSSIRPPFESLFSDCDFCPSGCAVLFSTDSSHIQYSILSSFDDINQHAHLSNSQMFDDFRLAMKSISYLYAAYLPNFRNLSSLLFSGGIDSTVLATMFSSDSVKSFIYKDYGNDQELRLAKYLSRFFGFNLSVVSPNSTSININNIVQRCSGYIHAFVSPAYLSFLSQSSKTSNLQTPSAYYISGQNSDTLFHVDCFAPPSWLGGIRRFVSIISTSLKRFYSSTIWFAILHRCEFLYSQIFSCKYLPKTLVDLLSPSYLTTGEHASFASDISLPANLNHRYSFLRFKYKHFLKPVLACFGSVYNIDFYNTSLSELHPMHVNHLVRAARWFRSIHNFSSSFYNRSVYENSLYLTPFSEGPVVSTLLHWRIGLHDCFSIKSACQRLIEIETSSSYSRLRCNCFGSYIKSDLILVVAKIKSLLFKLFYKITLRPSRSIEGQEGTISSIPVSLDVYINLFDLANLARRLICFKSSSRLSSLSSKTLLSILTSLDSYDNYRDLSRYQKMEVCRSLSTIFFLL